MLCPMKVQECLFFIILFHYHFILCQPSISNGSFCAFADFNNDKMTDILINDGGNIFVRVQSEDGKFTDLTDFEPIKFKSEQIVSCAVGDFNSDGLADILLTIKNSVFNSLSTIACIFDRKVLENNKRGFKCFKLIEKLPHQPILVDINADGASDVLFFDSNLKINCKLGAKSDQFLDCTDRVFSGFDSIPFPHFSHGFIDLNGDLSAELVFGVYDTNGNLALQIWKRKNNIEWENDMNIALPVESKKKLLYGQSTFGDVNGDGFVDIIMPRCLEHSGNLCSSVDLLVLWNSSEWLRLSLDINSYNLVLDEDETFQMRIGDYTLDGYPDLIAVLESDTKSFPFIFENQPCNGMDCTLINRKFVLNDQIPVQSFEMADGTILLATFFDLTEDGNLDIIVEFEDRKGAIKHAFLGANGQGDTTFLKVQVYSNVCYECRDYKGMSTIGSGISWHGVSLRYTMSDSSGGKIRGTHTLLSQTSHRALQLPYATFGLGRSPNFVEELSVGIPVVASDYLQNFTWKQMVPNSRIYIVPPTSRTNQWISRLYMTPSRLIIQSLIALSSICMVVSLLVVILHWREKRMDRKERQSQPHRFHFDAM